MTKGGFRIRIVFFLVMLEVLPPQLYAKPSYTCTSSSFGHFNSTPIPGGSSIWFTASLPPSATPATPNFFAVYWYMISFGQQPNGLPYECHNYPPVNTIDFITPPAEAELTYQDSTNSWTAHVPLGLGGNTFLAGCAIPPCSSAITSDCIPPSGLPGGLPVTWTMEYKLWTSQPVFWQWGAAVYSQFPPCKEVGECQGFAPLGIKAVDSSQPSLSCVNINGSTSCQTFSNSDLSGTPENYKQFVIGGGMGNGGTDYTGTSTATQVRCFVYPL
jgi:hypothetical protein